MKKSNGQVFNGSDGLVVEHLSHIAGSYLLIKDGYYY